MTSTYINLRGLRGYFPNPTRTRARAHARRSACFPYRSGLQKTPQTPQTPHAGVIPCPDPHCLAVLRAANQPCNSALDVARQRSIRTSATSLPGPSSTITTHRNIAAPAGWRWPKPAAGHWANLPINVSTNLASSHHRDARTSRHHLRCVRPRRADRTEPTPRATSPPDATRCDWRKRARMAGG